MEYLFCQDLSLFTFPVNLMAGIFLILGIWVLHRYYSSATAVKYLTGMPATLLVTAIIIAFLIIEGIWGFQLFKTWIFILLLFLLLVILGLVILKKVTDFTPRRVLFLLNHGGLWLAITAALLGASDREEYKLIAPLGQPEYNGIDAEGIIHPLPFTVRLDKFELEHYPSQEGLRVPKRFCSTITLKSQGGEQQLAVEVNRPAHFKGYTLYQDSYDISKGSDSRYTVLLVVRDPWLFPVYAGIFMLLAGAVGLAIYGPMKKQIYDLE